MNHPDGRQNSDDMLVFASESESDPLNLINENKPKKFKLLIVDDEKEIHVMTKLVLSDYSFHHSTLKFLSAYSAEEAKKLINDNPDAACILLDVVMEKKDSGLEIVKFIREEAKNDKIRIILRTGQPGKAPENDIIFNYDINDYKEKTELTTQKLFTTITTALRSYTHLLELEKKNALIEEKNNQLNDEVARRIVAESNLTKYNRSLEKMIDDKSNRLKTALKALQKKEKELRKADQLAQVGNVSTASLVTLDDSSDHLKSNLKVLGIYQSDMANLLDKYETLQNIITSHSETIPPRTEHTQSTIEEIDQYKKNIHLNEILKKYPLIIKDSTEGISQISKTVNDIKRFTSISNEKLMKQDLNQMLQKVLNQLKALFSSAIEIQSTFNTLPVIPVAKQNIEKAFYELLKNAFEALDNKGIVSISTAFTDPYIEIHISDIGLGIPSENMENIFKPYFTTKGREASGLGLSYSKSVISNHSGTIDIKSVLSEGTDIMVMLPVQTTN